ncbi:MAG: carbon storage regulator [Planctomycetaceae bacterium]|nr:carbon storage regulator [Planctomycetaceae bacterium]
MLVFTRRIGEQIQIGDQITVTLTRVDDGQVRIGVEAPAGVPIVRDELIESLKLPAGRNKRRRKVRDT